jgi:hypothetical protein
MVNNKWKRTSEAEKILELKSYCFTAGDIKRVRVGLSAWVICSNSLVQTQKVANGAGPAPLGMLTVIQPPSIYYAPLVCKALYWAPWRNTKRLETIAALTALRS